MKRIILILLATASTVMLSAQKGKVTTAAFELEQGNLMKAKEAIDQAVLHAETSLQPRTWRLKGDIYSNIYATKVFLPQAPDALFQAEAAYKKCVELDVNSKKKEDVTLGIDNVGIYIFQEGVTLFQKDDFAGAYKYLDASRLLNKFMIENGLTNVLDTNYVLITAYAAQNLQNYPVAIDLYRQLFAISAENETVYSNLADLLMLVKGNDEEVLKVINKGRAMYPNDKNLIISELNYYLSKGRVAEVTDKLEAAITADPENPALYFALGTAYDQLKQEEKAKAAYQKAIEKKPDYYDAYFNLGAMYYNQAIIFNRQMNETPDSDIKTYKKLEGERNALYNLALPYLEKAYTINPTGQDNKIALKEIYARMSMFEKLNSIK